MMIPRLLLFFSSFTTGILAATGDDNFDNFDYDVLQYVDPLIGSVGGGNVFAGASLPYGMAKAVADTDSPSNQGGFAYDGSNITGFSSLHDSGTGGSPSLGNFPLFPYVNCDNDDVNSCAYPKKDRKTGYDTSSVSASPGYFGLTMDSGVMVDMTASHHSSLFRFRFPTLANGTSPLILLDLTDLSNTRQDNGTISVDPETGQMKGHARFLPSFGSGSYVPYFCADFQSGSESGMRDNGIFVNSRASTDVKDLKISRSINGYPLPGGAFVRFHGSSDQTILARVGVSFISSDQACMNAVNEVPGFNFVGTHSAAVNLWTEKMTPIRVSKKGVDSSLLTSFYSGIYRTMINPQDYTGENPLWNSTEPYFDSFYCLWDSFRTQLPFLTIFDPKSVTRMIRSLIATQQHLGWLPDCRMSLCKGYTQGGSSADIVLADAFMKNLTDINWTDAYTAAKKDADHEPYDWSAEGRGGLHSWKTHHYIPVEDFDHEGFGPMTRSITRTLEYAYDDFAVAQIARGLNYTEDAERYEERAGYWRNLFRGDVRSVVGGRDSGFEGFLQPRFLNGSWGYQDPITCSSLDTSGQACSLQNNGAETFEDSIWEYQFFVPHDMRTLIQTLGGPTPFINRLTYLHTTSLASITNEPSFLTPFQYHYAARPALSTHRIHSTIRASFAATPSGLPGNDDSGAMGSFLAWAMMGLFPNAGQDVYLITVPFSEEVRVTSPVTGKTARVRVEVEGGSFDPAHEVYYVQEARLNGERYGRSWVDHGFFGDGGDLVLVLGERESEWGTREEDLPPSLSTRS